MGSAEDYKREFGDTPFGLLVRKIAKLEHEAALLAFSEFISDQSLNQYQIVFVKKIIDFIMRNGYIENTFELLKPPFDKPQNFMKLFDSEKQRRLLEIIENIKNNALNTVS